MIRRILVAIDGSVSSRAALSIAGSLAGILKTELMALYVEDVGRLVSNSVAESALQNVLGSTTFGHPKPPEELAEIEMAFVAEADALRQEFQVRCATAGVDGRFLVLRGHPEEVIAERSRIADFVVVGNIGRGSTTVRRFTIEGLLRNTARPVLVVPTEAKGESKMVVAYDGSGPSERVLRAAAEFCEISHIEEIHLFTVGGDGDEIAKVQATAREYLTAYSMEIFAAHGTGPVQDAIARYVAEVDASVLALGAFGSSRLKEAVFGSTTEAFIEDSEAALLLIS